MSDCIPRCQGKLRRLHQRLGSSVESSRDQACHLTFPPPRSAVRAAAAQAPPQTAVTRRFRAVHPHPRPTSNMAGDSWAMGAGRGGTTSTVASPRYNTNRPVEWTRIEAEARSRPAPMRRSVRATLWTLWSTSVTIYVHISEALRWVGRCIATSWRILLILTFLTVMTPIMLFTSPLTMSFLQLLLGCGLAAATWVIVKHPTEKAQERMTSDRVQPEMHLVLGTLLPELAVNLERLLLWVDLAMRGHQFLKSPLTSDFVY